MTTTGVEDELILLSAGTAARRRAARGRAAQLAAGADWRRMAELLRVRRLLPTLGPRVLELAGGRASAELEAAVTDALDAGRRQGALLHLIAVRTMGALAGAGVRSSALKGPLLGEALYGDLGRRPSGDIDLLVAPDQLYEAVAVVRGLGYAQPPDHVGEGGLPLLHFALTHERAELPPVELHWRVHWYESHFACERLLAPTLELAHGWRPAPVDELVALLLFYARDGFIGLRHATDIGAWWDAFGAALPAGALDRRIDSYPALAPALVAAVQVAGRTVGLPVERLTGRRGQLGPRARVAVRLANPYPHSSQAQIYADMGLIDGLLAPRGGLGAFFRRQVAPPRATILEHAPATGGRWARSTVGHSVRVLGRYGLAMTRLARTPQASR